MSGGEATADKLRRIMESEGDAVRKKTTMVNQLSDFQASQFSEFEDLRSEARAIKKEAIENLPELIDELRSAVEGNGGMLYLADDAEDANQYITSVASEAGVESAVKSKSMTTEEIELNNALIENGVEVTETDLGEFVIQVVGDKPSHLIGPAMHLSAERIAEEFNDAFNPDEEIAADPRALTDFAREKVGEAIMESDLGITGANFVAAETGTIAIVTNEGNARKTAVTPSIHIAVTGVEKVVPSVSDLQPFLELIARMGTGQDLTSYFSMLSPPVETLVPDFESDSFSDEREFHLVLIDNGRMEMRDDDDLREVLYCIRCGACANACANFQSLGGHAFGGHTYTGGIGTGWEAGIFGEESASEFNDLCTGCTQCVPKCPVKIDIPWINTVVRSRYDENPGFLVEGLAPDGESGFGAQKRFFGNIEMMVGFGALAPRVSNYLLSNRAVKAVLERGFGLDSRRELPRFDGSTLRERIGSEPSGDGELVVLYPDMYTNYFWVERGLAVAELLHENGFDVVVPDVGESGRAPLSQGMIETARDRAMDVFDSLSGYLEDGCRVVVVEPSDLAMFRHDYEKLLPSEDTDLLRESSFEAMEFIDQEIDIREDIDGGREVFYHSHCQQRTLDLEDPSVSVLEKAGFNVDTSSVECCGMAGSFGYKSQYYEVSVDVGEQLVNEVSSELLSASGTSCAEQLSHLMETDVSHPAELLIDN